MNEADPSPGDVHIRDVEDDDLELFFSHQQDPEALRMAAFTARERADFMAHWAKIRADERSWSRKQSSLTAGWSETS